MEGTVVVVSRPRPQRRVECRDQRGVDGEVRLLTGLHPRQKRGAPVLVMLPSWQAVRLYVDLRVLQCGARSQWPLLQCEVGAQVAAGSCVALGPIAWMMWRQMRGAGLQRALDVAMSDARQELEGV